MPLVTRTSLQGNFFQQDDEPANWDDADLWADTNLSPRGLFINNNGTALRLGTTSLDETGSDTFFGVAAGGTVAPDALFNPGTTYTTRASVTVDVDNDDSFVTLVGVVSCYQNAVTRTDSIRIRESTTVVVAEVTNVREATQVEPILAIGTISGVSSGNHTYDLQHHLSVSDASDRFFNASIGAVVVT